MTPTNYGCTRDSGDEITLFRIQDMARNFFGFGSGSFLDWKTFFKATYYRTIVPEFQLTVIMISIIFFVSKYLD